MNNSLHTTSVSLAVTPTVVSTLFSHFLNKKLLKSHPTVHLSYDEGLHLIRSFLDYASHHTVEELQGFTSQWVPHPHWVKMEDATIPEEHLGRAAEIIQEALGEDGIRQVGGRQWWQWRGVKSLLEAEWIEMRSDAQARKKSGEPLRRVMMYVHGGAYYFGSVDVHRYQLQRHARKLKARVLAPRYRLSPQFPFPCGLQDCLATYLHLLTFQDPNTIILAGDSAGGGMVLALLCLLRDQDVPLPAGGILLSPWVDLTHSFPSVSKDAPLDYIPSTGFHHKPSLAWPPPNDIEFAMIHAEVEKRKKNAAKKVPSVAELESRLQEPVTSVNANAPGIQFASGGIQSNTKRFLTVAIDGVVITMTDQIQMYTTNSLLSHPLVSPVMQPSLGGLPPLLIQVGGGEVLRDEQIYVAHKCANPTKYAPAPEVLTDHGRKLLAKYKPTDVQLQVWDDLCHVAPTLSFTQPAKYMYRSIAQFGAWALARAQRTGVEVINDSEVSVISSSSSDTEARNVAQAQTNHQLSQVPALNSIPTVGKAGDPLPPFKNHMIRQRVSRMGHVTPLPPEEEFPACRMNPSEIGVIKEGPVRKWLETRRKYDHKYLAAKAKVHKKLIVEMVTGYRDFGLEECPPPSALARRVPVLFEAHDEKKKKKKKKKKNIGLALWSLWGSKHDEEVVLREQHGREHEDEGPGVAKGSGTGPGSADPSSSQRHSPSNNAANDENETEGDADQETLIAQLLAMRRGREAPYADNSLQSDFSPETGVAGKRPFLDGIALPFSIKNEAETSSMRTLHSDETSAAGSRPVSASSFRPESIIQFHNEGEDEEHGKGKRPAWMDNDRRHLWDGDRDHGQR